MTFYSLQIIKYRSTKKIFITCSYHYSFTKERKLQRACLVMESLFFRRTWKKKTMQNSSWIGCRCRECAHWKSCQVSRIWAPHRSISAAWLFSFPACRWHQRFSLKDSAATCSLSQAWTLANCCWKQQIVLARSLAWVLTCLLGAYCDRHQTEDRLAVRRVRCRSRDQDRQL